MGRLLIVHPPHARADWTSLLRRELVAAFRRGSMDAAKCLHAYCLQGGGAVLPPEAVVYLTVQAAADRAERPVDRVWLDGAIGQDVLGSCGREEFVGVVEAARRFFFPAAGPAE